MLLYSFEKLIQCRKSCQDIGKLFDNAHRTVYSGQQNRGVDRVLSITEKVSQGNFIMKAFIELFPRGDSRQTSESIFETRFEKFQKIEIELDVIEK